MPNRLLKKIKNIFENSSNSEDTERQSMEVINEAIEQATGHKSSEEEKKIIRSLFKFGNTTAKQVMTSRMDMMALDVEDNFEEVLNHIAHWGFSRIPVYRETLDRIEGILHVKNLFIHRNESKDFAWQKLVRPVEFIPETKKIGDLLRELQTKRHHLAIVVDEYGGTAGLITMEDIIEEIIGEINDEFDEVEYNHIKLADNSYVFEAKTSINDFCKALNLDADLFDEVKKESESLGGLLLELKEDMPKMGDHILFRNFEFIVESADSKRIKKVKVLIHEEQNEEAEQ